MIYLTLIDLSDRYTYCTTVIHHIYSLCVAATFNAINSFVAGSLTTISL